MEVDNRSGEEQLWLGNRYRKSSWDSLIHNLNPLQRYRGDLAERVLPLPQRNLEWANQRINKGLLCYWPLRRHFDESGTKRVFDYSGNGIKGTITGSVLGSEKDIGSATRHDGIDDWILGASNLGVSGDAAITMACLIYWDDIAWSSNHVCAMGNDGSGSDARIKLTTRSGRLGLDFWGVRFWATSPSTMSVQQVYHVAATKTPGNIGTTSKLFINGVEVAGAYQDDAADPDHAPNIANTPPTVGRLDSTRWFKGFTAEHRWYGRALSSQEVAELARSTLD